MQHPRSLFVMALLLPACAAGIWDKRVYSCEEVTRIEVDRSSIEVTDNENDDDDCYVEVTNLSNHSVKSGALQGTGLFVYINGSVELNVEHTLLDYRGDLTIEGPRGDYVWLPDSRQLQATDVTEDEDDWLLIDGPISSVKLINAGYVELMAGAGFKRLEESSVFEMDFSTQETFEAIELVADGRVYMQVPQNAVYGLNLLSQSGDVELDIKVRTVEVDPTSEITIGAGETIELYTGAGGSYQPAETYRDVRINCQPGQPDRVEILLESNIEGVVAYFDAVNTEDRPSHYESHRLIRAPSELSEGLQEGNFSYRKNAYLDTDYDPTGFGTDFGCEPDVDFNEAEKGDQMSYLLRIYDEDGNMLDCFSVGNDSEGMVYRVFANENTFGPKSITPNACDWPDMYVNESSK